MTMPEKVQVVAVPSNVYSGWLTVKKGLKHMGYAASTLALVAIADHLTELLVGFKLPSWLLIVMIPPVQGTIRSIANWLKEHDKGE
jgi:hypothetical protein